MIQSWGRKETTGSAVKKEKQTAAKREKIWRKRLNYRCKQQQTNVEERKGYVRLRTEGS